MGYRRVRIGGADLEIHVSGPADAPSLLVLHLGAPSAATGYPAYTAAAASRGLRLVMYSRPGYGHSDRVSGRSVADEGERTAALADRLGYRSYFVAGLSSGGPPALACAALTPERVRACVTVASPAPPEEIGAAWAEWAGPTGVARREQMLSDRRAELVPSYEAAVPAFRRMTARRLSSMPALTEADRRTNLGDSRVGEGVARGMRRSVLRGIWGWFDDSVAQAGDWGFRVADITTPVVVRHGEQDGIVDVRNGRWLASAIPGAVADIRPEDGHASIADPFDDLVEQLIRVERRHPREDRQAGEMT